MWGGGGRSGWPGVRCVLARSWRFVAGLCGRVAGLAGVPAVVAAVAGSVGGVAVLSGAGVWGGGGRPFLLSFVSRGGVSWVLFLGRCALGRCCYGCGWRGVACQPRWRCGVRRRVGGAVSGSGARGCAGCGCAGGRVAAECCPGGGRLWPAFAVTKREAAGASASLLTRRGEALAGGDTGAAANATAPLSLLGILPPTVQPGVLPGFLRGKVKKIKG